MDRVCHSPLWLNGLALVVHVVRDELETVDTYSAIRSSKDCQCDSRFLVVAWTVTLRSQVAVFQSVLAVVTSTIHPLGALVVRGTLDW